MRVLARTDSGEEAIRLSLQDRPDVVLMDVLLKGLNGIGATRKILESQPSATILGFSCCSECSYVREMLDAGAAGYVLKNASLPELINAIHRVNAGDAFISPQLHGALLPKTRMSAEDAETPSLSALTERERDTLTGIASGKTIPQVAEWMGVTESTVHTHRRRIMRKLRIHDSVSLARFAIKTGLVSLDG